MKNGLSLNFWVSVQTFFSWNYWMNRRDILCTYSRHRKSQLFITSTFTGCVKPAQVICKSVYRFISSEKINIQTEQNELQSFGCKVFPPLLISLPLNAATERFCLATVSSNQSSCSRPVVVFGQAAQLGAQISRFLVRNHLLSEVISYLIAFIDLAAQNWWPPHVLAYWAKSIRHKSEKGRKKTDHPTNINGESAACAGFGNVLRSFKRFKDSV